MVLDLSKISQKIDFPPAQAEKGAQQNDLEIERRQSVHRKKKTKKTHIRRKNYPKANKEDLTPTNMADHFKSNRTKRKRTSFFSFFSPAQNSLRNRKSIIKHRSRHPLDIQSRDQLLRPRLHSDIQSQNSLFEKRFYSDLKSQKSLLKPKFHPDHQEEFTINTIASAFRDVKSKRRNERKSKFLNSKSLDRGGSAGLRRGEEER